MPTDLTTPLTLDDLLCEGRTFKPETHAAMRKLARSKPWRGTFTERLAKIVEAFGDLTAAYDVTGWTIRHAGPRNGDSSASMIDPDTRQLVITGRPSVTTLLHLFHKVRQVERQVAAGVEREAVVLDHVAAMRWSVTLFQRRFPISFSRCTLENGLLVNAGLIARERAAYGADADAIAITDAGPDGSGD